MFLDDVCAKGVVRRYVNTLFVGNKSVSMVFKVIVFGVQSVFNYSVISVLFNMR